MLDGDFSYYYEDIRDHVTIRVRGLRTFQLVISAILLFAFIFEFLRVRKEATMLEKEEERKLKLKYRNWYAFLIFINLVVLMNDTWAPICWLQLLPLFEFPEDEDER